jgi:NAD(P)-dependent dehydrogenase (short-subunit alcohol dehydrogenase family)
MPLAGRVALVTGASAGIGRHFAGVLARAGARVAVAARNAEALEAVCREAGAAMAVTLDVTDRASVEAALSETENILGPPDILVNNAGVAATAPLLDLEEAIWDQVLDTNLKGAFLVAQAAARRMRERGGAIVNVASILGLRVAGQVSAYAASKAGLVQLTRAMALEWARYGIRVNALCPGYVETGLNRAFIASEAGQALLRRIPMRRLVRLEELDGPLLLLCGDAGSAITGAVLAVDGGHLVSGL